MTTPIASNGLEGLAEGPEGDTPMSFWDHLGELRSRLTRAALGVTVSVVFCFIYATELREFLAAPLHKAWVAANMPGKPELQVLAMMDAWPEENTRSLVLNRVKHYETTLRQMMLSSSDSKLRFVVQRARRAIDWVTGRARSAPAPAAPPPPPPSVVAPASASLISTPVSSRVCAPWMTQRSTSFTGTVPRRWPASYRARASPSARMSSCARSSSRLAMVFPFL